ncbi:hypothetical protein D3C75_729550 [compost metagenome]
MCNLAVFAGAVHLRNVNALITGKLAYTWSSQDIAVRSRSCCLYCSWSRCLGSRCFGMAAFLLGNIAFCGNDGYNFTYTADLAVLGEHFQHCTVDWGRNFHYSLVILYFHDDIIVGNFVAGFDMHFDNFTFMQTFP